jgi:preprotein translocase subunit SecE
MLKIREYISDSFGELLNKVTWPTWSELTSSSIVVLVASLIIALIIFIIDLAFSRGMTTLYETLF